MNTSFLKGLGLEQEVIDKIMAENGRDVEREKSRSEAKLEDYNAKTLEIDQLKKDNAAIQKQASESEAYKTKMDELQTRYTDLQAELTAAKTDYEQKWADRDKADADKADSAALDSALERHLKAAGANPDPLILEGLMNKFDRSALKRDGDTITNWEDVSKSVIAANAQHFGKEKTKAADVADPPVGNPTSYTMEDVKKMSTQEINKNWDKVKPVLEKGK